MYVYVRARTFNFRAPCVSWQRAEGSPIDKEVPSGTFDSSGLLCVWNALLFCATQAETSSYEEVGSPTRRGMPPQEAEMEAAEAQPAW